METPQNTTEATGESSEQERKDIIRTLFSRKVLLPADAVMKLKDARALQRVKALIDLPDLSVEKVVATIEEKPRDAAPNRIETAIAKGTFSVVKNYPKESQKRTVQDFVAYFNSRYRFLSSLLRGRQELQGATAIGRLQGKAEREQIAIIGCIIDIQETKNNNLLITVEDPTGKATLLISKSSQELFGQGKELVQDEVVGFTGTMGKSLVYVKTITWPDVPLHKELRKAPKEEFAIFLSDIHVGSVDFLKEPFERFIAWLNGQVGTEQQKELVKKIKYAFIVGDMVDGVGIYPRQQKELIIEDISEQYAEFARYVKRFPDHISVIICPGNHDAIRLAEPQPPLYEDIAGPLYDLPNVTMVSNPAVINVSSSDGHPGLDILLYHGYSFDYYVAAVDHIRNHGGYDRADLVMKFLLRRRHLAPTHASSVYVPTVPDPLLITDVPDIFVSGHIHKASASQYRNVTLLSGSCWQRTTPFQRKVGHHPEPARVPLVNLQTRKVKLLRFMDEEDAA